jgi:thioredoxin reductase
VTPAEVARPSGTLGGPVSFLFDGRRVRARAGQSIGAALHAAGIRVLSHSTKYRRPRGLYCVAGVCPNCAMRVNGLPGVAACATPLAGGEVVEREGRWPWLAPVLDAASPLVPAGFYYGRLLARHPRLWRVAARVLGEMAGVSALPEASAAHAAVADGYEERDVDTVVVGAGMTGLTAACEISEADRRSAALGAPRPSGVVVVERDERAGGLLLAEPDGAQRADALAAEALAVGVELRCSSVAFGWYDEGVLAVATVTGVTAFRPRRVVLATGTYERGAVLANGDLPGVLLGGGCQQLLVRDGVLPGRSVVVLTDEEYGHCLAALLRQAGADVVVVDRRPAGDADADRIDGAVQLLSGSDVAEVHGRRCVEAVTVRGADGVPRQLRCDTVAIALGRRPADELLRMGGLASGLVPMEWRGEICRRLVM